MSRAGDFVDRTLPVESKMRAKARGRLFRIRLQCGRCDSITDQSGTARLDVSALLRRAAHACGPRQPRTGDVGITNEADEIPPRF
jgi:hypothetical protein